MLRNINLIFCYTRSFILLDSSTFYYPLHYLIKSSLAPQLHCKNSYLSKLSSLLLTHLGSTQILHPPFRDDNHEFCSSSAQWLMLSLMSSYHLYFLCGLCNIVPKSVLLHGYTCCCSIKVKGHCNFIEL